MAPTKSTATLSKWKWLHIVCGAILIATFFMDWAIWDGTKMSGYQMPAGTFFKTSATQFGLDNPFPQFSFTFLVFWLIPVLATVSILLSLGNKKAALVPYATGLLALSLAALYILFTKTLIDFGAGKELLKMLQWPPYLHIVAAVGLVLTTDAKSSSFSLLKKSGWILAGPVFVFISFMFIQNYLEKQTFEDTASVKADYTISANELIKEFITNDTATNKKYLEKTLAITGNASSVEVLADSTSTIQFADSTGSYAIFSLEKDQLEKVKTIKTGDPVSLKGVCSGSIFSEILGTTSISFKRATFNNK
jgi:tRNA_anti-like